ncbi:hypothetical protein [Chryseobacterium limigenitum]|uniref:Uncharacterized protein n=1 Tax=Chryseobacterium limigenitum TaxID=1612149 RepID=A0A1K2IDB6_9FLAO|nr:hypothetical protein [Chryseobacterium limigenitum]SFZ90288.1 hypothetical protein SAMN05216324_101293 [Chryseobacterium limigenitum]
MATYESLIKINGAVGDLVFYTLNGKNVVRKKSGFNKTAFKKSPAYEKVRQNSSEFGHCSKVGKIIRQVLDEYIKQAEDPLLYQKFAKLMTEIKDLDVISERGKRTVENGIITEKGKLLLRKFQFGNKNNFDSENYVSLDFFNEKLYLNNTFSTNEAVLISLKIDFENYSAKHFEEKISVIEKEKISFTKQFSDDDLILYFIVLKKDDEILNMGFV